MIVYPAATVAGFFRLEEPERGCRTGTLQRINPPESGLSPCPPMFSAARSALRAPSLLAPRSRRSSMTQLPADPVRPPRFKKARAAALGFGLGATLALSPLVWAQNPPADTTITPAPSVA